MMIRIGITGGVGSGKSMVLDYLKSKGYQVFQADQIARRLQEPGNECYREIVETFGLGVVASDGTLDRTALAMKIFSDEEGRLKINSIVHPRVNAFVESTFAELETRGEKAAFLEAAIMADPFYRAYFDEIWYIYSKEDLRRERLKAQRDYPDAKIDSIFRAQASEAEFRAISDRVIANNDSFEQTEKEIDEALREVLNEK